MGESVYEAMGGAEGCRKLSTAFYARVQGDPVLRPLFPGKSMRCAVEAFAAFLCQFLGDSAEDSQFRWWLSLEESHRRFGIGAEHRVAWVENMREALSDVPMAETARVALLDFFRHSSAYVVNQGDRPAVAGIDGELDRRWNAQLELDAIVAAVRNADDERAVALAGKAISETHNRSVIVGILSVMMGGNRDPLRRFVGERVVDDPALVYERRAGRTLLHFAAAQGDDVTVSLLLHSGAEADAKTSGGHTPLYCLANECGTAGTERIVRLLVQHGADVNAADGVKRCTPLHMAARRGFIETAGALLDCGADIEALDSLGETPLRRAVNCNKTGVAALFLSRGADRHSWGRRGLTPLLAARSEAMKRVLTAESGREAD